MEKQQQDPPKDEMLWYVSYRIQLQMKDGREVVARLMGKEKLNNLLIMAECEEIDKDDKNKKKDLGYVYVKRESIVLWTAEGRCPREVVAAPPKIPNPGRPTFIMIA
ncbi:small nuclear ribonucleoprotein-associated protein B'-like protein [Tanacetum coccineum]